MELQSTPTYITIVNTDHTITLPPDVPVGATVAVVLMPSVLPTNEVARQARFEKTLTAIRAATAQPAPTITDSQLDALIKRARKTPVA